MDFTSLPPLHPSALRPVLFPALMTLFAVGILAFEWRARRKGELPQVWHPERPATGPRLAAFGNEPAHAELQAGQWLAALHALAAVPPDPLDAWTPFHMGLCYEELGRWRDAETCYQAALQADRHHRDASYNLARLLAATQRVPEAIGRYRQLPEDADALFNLGHLYFQLKLYAQAVEAWKAARQVDPHAVDVRVNLKLVGRLRRAAPSGCYSP
jgi:tetratricopeptide (TPR) repeat protein